MAFENVQPGDAWRPEPAARYNAVNDLLNRTAAPTEARQTRLGDHRGALIVLGEVPSGAVVEQYAPVYLGSGAVVQGGADRADVVFPLAEAGDVWGIAQQSASGGVVSVCLQGLTPVRVSGGAIAPGTRLAPTSGGYLASAALGDARALQTHNVASGGTIIAQLTPDMAGGGGGYESYFTLTWDSANNIVTIADGATGGDSVAVANGWDLYTLAPKSFAITNNYYLFYLKYTPAIQLGGQLDLQRLHVDRSRRFTRRRAELAVRGRLVLRSARAAVVGVRRAEDRAGFHGRRRRRSLVHQMRVTRWVIGRCY